jgi:type VI secretion system protein ImpH
MSAGIPLDKELVEEPYRFNFFQAVRLFEKVVESGKPVGRDSLPEDEIVRFRTRVGMDFPASEIHEVREVTDERTGKTKYEMLVTFMGMVGISGVLPIHYTELVLDRIRHRDTAMWAFLDIFTHRAVSLFFRAWEKYRFPVAYERGNDDFTSYLFDFTGLGTAGLRGRLGINDESLLPYAGLISQKPHSTNALENIVSDYFDVPASVDQFFGQWLPISSSDYTLLGRANGKLGANAIAGTSIWDQQSKIRLRIGPISLQKFQSFLPVGTANKALRSIVRFIAGRETDFDIQMVLAAKQVPGLVLTTRAVRRPMLGWTTWLKTKPFVTDDSQLVLEG